MEIKVQNYQGLKSGKGNLVFSLFKSPKVFENTEAVFEEKSYEVNELLQSLRSAQDEWMNANLNFENVFEKEMVDYYAYKIKACEVRYEYLIRKAKEIGLRVEISGRNSILGNAGVNR